MYYSFLSLKMISFVLFPQALEPSMNFNISKLVYFKLSICVVPCNQFPARRYMCQDLFSEEPVVCFWLAATTKFSHFGWSFTRGLKWIRHNCIFVNLYLLLVWGTQVLIPVVNFQLLWTLLLGLPNQILALLCLASSSSCLSNQMKIIVRNPL